MKDYEVGYKKPPKEHQFKPKQSRKEYAQAKPSRKEVELDVAGILDKPLRLNRAGKAVSMHPHEALLTSLGKRALKGEARAAKLFLKHCEAAGLLEPAPVEQTDGVFEIPKGANPGIVRVLLETEGLPPWDPVVYAALEAEYRQDAENIETIYRRFLKENGYEE
jgi:hypothetical protein